MKSSLGLGFKGRVLLDNVLTIIALVIGLAAGYSNLEARQARLAEKVATVEQTIKERVGIAEARALTTDSRLRAVEVMQASQTSDLRNIQVGINEIKSALDRLSRSGSLQ